MHAVFLSLKTVLDSSRGRLLRIQMVSALLIRLEAFVAEHSYAHAWGALKLDQVV